MLKRDKILFYHNLTIKKLFNVFLIEVQRMLKINNVIGHPYFATIEPCNYCNLKCVLCSTGGNFDASIERGKISVDTFKEIINKYGKYLLMMNLFTFGEPFLNKDIFKMVKIAEDKGIGVRISTNLQIFNEQMTIDMIRSGLQYLTVSVDGSTQEIYETYRRGGSLYKILIHVEQLQKKKRELNSKYPIIEFQTLIFKHNQNDIQNIKKLADSYGAYHQVLEASLLDSDKTDFLPTKEDKIIKTSSPNKVCNWLYRWIVLNWNGDIYPCCNVNGYIESKFGHISNIGEANQNTIKGRKNEITPCKNCKSKG